jgi:preprotein translocase subunit SecA
VPVPLDPAKFRSLIYRQYGAHLEVKGIVEDRTGTLDRLAGEVGSSMVQQRERVLDTSEEVLQSTLDEHCPPHQHAEDWDLDALTAAIKERFGFQATIRTDRILEREALAEMLWAEVEKIIEAREAEFQLPMFLYLARYFMTEEIDQRWIEHLKAMEALREGIGLRGYGQKDPKQEYKKEGFDVFGVMMSNISRNVAEKLFHVQLRREEAAAPPPMAARKPRKTVESGGGTQPATAAAAGNGGGGDGGEARPLRRAEPKVGRNDPCPCGSGKKYKKCHGNAQPSA